MSVGLWLVLLLPLACAAIAVFGSARVATAAGRAGALASALWTTLVALEMPAGVAASVPWMPASGIAFSLRLDPLATLGLLGVAWLTASAAMIERGPRLALLLVGEAAALAAWLADDLGVMIAAWTLLPLVAAGLVGRSRQSAFATFIPLASGAATLTLAAALLALGHQEASVGTWSFALPALATAVLPPADEALVAGLLLAAAWLTMGLWPFHGWWQSALEEGEASPAAALWLPAVVRPLGLWLLLRVAAPLAAESVVRLAPALLLGIAASALVGLALARGEADPRRLHRPLAHLPIAAAALGALSMTSEGAIGALLLGLGGAIALALAELAGHLRGGALARVGLSAGNLGLLGAPGLLGFAGLVLVAPAALAQGTWVSAAIPAVALLLLVGSMALFAPVASRASRGAPQRVLPPVRVPASLVGALLALLVLLGLAPGTIADRATDAGSPWMVSVHHRWCTSAAAGLLRPRLAEAVSPGYCERPIAAIREGRARPTSVAPARANANPDANANEDPP